MADVDFSLATANPKQVQFFKSRKRYVAYGGARGGGKSWAVDRKAPLMCLTYPGIKILLLRRTYKDLERNHVRALVPLLQGIARYNKTDKCFTFKEVDGKTSILELGYCAGENDVLQYQGLEYDVIFIDEATQFTEYMFEILTACVRGANDFPKRVYLTCNPGGVGHEWVKRLFVSRKYKESEDPDDYEFIPATIYDNKQLLEQDKGYVQMLDNLSPELREMWRDGNWDILAGRYFDEFDRAVHVVEPFTIPPHWKCYRAIDYGLDCLACVWAAVDEHGDIYIYREYAESGKTPSEGAHDIVELSKDENIQYTAAPRDVWARSQESARTKADLFREGGLPLTRSGVDRESGWLALKQMLEVKGEGELRYARLRFFSTCSEIIEYLPALQRDPHHPTDCMTEPHEITHLPDALRYLVVRYLNPSDAIKPQKTPLQKFREKAIKGGSKKKRSYF